MERVSSHISKSDTNMREALSAKVKLQVTVRFLARAGSFKNLEYMFRAPKIQLAILCHELAKLSSRNSEDSRESVLFTVCKFIVENISQITRVVLIIRLIKIKQFAEYRKKSIYHFYKFWHSYS